MDIKRLFGLKNNYNLEGFFYNLEKPFQIIEKMGRFSKDCLIQEFYMKTPSNTPESSTLQE